MKVTAYQIIETLQKKGYEAYFAGGCVRDMLLGTQPKDFDIATSATPDQVEEIFEKTVPIGKSFGVILVIQNGHHYEIATFRSESEYADGRRPTKIEFTTAQQDALRRDFTINGLFFDPLKGQSGETQDQVVDFVEGQKDLKARLIRFIGDPEKRIQEDHLRILRAIRIKNMIDFQYHPQTYAAIKKNAALVKKVSGERIAAELDKILMSKNMRTAFDDMEDTGVLEAIIPELVKLKGLAQPYQYHQEGDVWEHVMRAVESLPDDATLEVRWATLLHDIGKYDTFQLAERIRYDHHASKSRDIARDILTRLHYPNKLIDHVCWIVEHHMTMVPLVTMPVAKRRKWFLHEAFPSLLQVFHADAAGTIPGDFSLYNQIIQLYQEDMKHMPVKPKKLLTGRDVMAILGIPPGKKLGEILEKLDELQLSGEIKTEDEARNWLKKL